MKQFFIRMQLKYYGWRLRNRVKTLLREKDSGTKPKSNNKEPMTYDIVMSHDPDDGGWRPLFGPKEEQQVIDDIDTLSKL